MNRILLLTLTICLLFKGLLSAKIIEAYDLKELSEQFQNLDSQSLLLWDVDSTLIMPTDLILRPGNDAIAAELEDHYFENKTTQEIGWLISVILQKMPFCLVDEGVKSLIENLQKRAVPMLGLTALHTGTFGVIDSMEQWRVDQLHRLGIDFSLIFSQHSDMEWKEDVPFRGYPVFLKGIICCDELPKGIVLTTFLQKIDWLPQKVMFIDDNLNFLRSVEEAMRTLKIPFTGVHYRAVEKMKNTIDRDLAHRQYQVLIAEEIWLPDEEARSYILGN